MTSAPADWEVPDSTSPVIQWLLDSDPAIRWQVLNDLLVASPDFVKAERDRVETDGWGARLLSMQGEDGQWEGGALFPARKPVDADGNEIKGQPWNATAYCLVSLVDFRIDPTTDRMRRGIELIRQNCRWEHAGQPFFEGEVEPCINGMTVVLGVHFGQDVSPIVERLLGEQLEDGGWNCEAEIGSVRSSFHTTIRVLEGLLAYERAFGPLEQVAEVRKRGEEYLLERSLFRSKSTGEVVDPAWLRFSFPTRWHYDVLRGLDYFRAVGGKPDSRLGEALALLRSKQGADGRWLLENTHPGAIPFAFEDGDGKPSRWNTLRALRVLKWISESGS